jgi:hypothetical protein
VRIGHEHVAAAINRNALRGGETAAQGCGCRARRDYAPDCHEFLNRIMVHVGHVDIAAAVDRNAGWGGVAAA